MNLIKLPRNIQIRRYGAFKKTVIYSKSHDVFTNLAYENWLYKNHDFTNNHVLMLWKNEPCVVIGLHQNPWLESNTRGILARRYSGGGTVYHDMGNLNLTFFTPKSSYNRKFNLDLICRVLNRDYNIKSEVNRREDLVVNDKKISGTAAKLGRNNSYHHCTILVNADKINLKKRLTVTELIETKASPSVKSPTLNLTDLNGNITVDKLSASISEEYLNSPGYKSTMPDSIEIKEILPTEQIPGIEASRMDLTAWEWVYGRTPKFSIRRAIKIRRNNFEVIIHVDKGVIKGYDVNDLNELGLHIAVTSVLDDLKNVRFSLDLLDELPDKIIGEICYNENLILS